MKTTKSNSQINIAFFGTSDKSVEILETLKNNFNLTLCVTKSDVKVGRKQTLKSPKVKTWAQENNIEVIQIDTLKQGDSQNKTIQALKTNKIDVAVVADFSFIIPENIFTIPEFGFINIHFSLLPKYRGASPVQHAILNGDEKTGITFQLIDASMDTGDILYQEEYALQGSETTATLYETLFKKAATTLPKVIREYIKGEIKPTPQDHTQATYCYSKTHPKSTYIYKEDAKINFSAPLNTSSDQKTPQSTQQLQEIERKVRAFYPWPIAYTTLEDMENANLIKLKKNQNKNLKVKIFEAELETKEAKEKQSPTLKIKTLQVEGKNKITWDEFLNGYGC